MVMQDAHLTLPYDGLMPDDWTRVEWREFAREHFVPVLQEASLWTRYQFHRQDLCTFIHEAPLDMDLEALSVATASVALLTPSFTLLAPVAGAMVQRSCEIGIAVGHASRVLEGIELEYPNCVLMLCRQLVRHKVWWTVGRPYQR